MSEGHGSYLALDVYAVEQRTANLVHITLYLPRGAHAGVGGVAIIAAGAGVHRGDKHETARKLGGVLGAGDGDLAVLKGLAQHFEGGFVELRQLIGEEHAVVGQGYLSGLGIGTATHEGHLGDSVVRAAEGTLRDETHVPA